MKKYYLLLVIASFAFISSCASKTDEIVIGGAISLTGDNALQGNRGFNAIQLSVAFANEQGGIGGKPIKFIAEDTQTTAKGAINAFTKLTKANKVSAVISTGDIEFQALNEITKSSEVVTLATICSGMLENNRSPYLFRYCFNEKTQDEYIMRFIKNEMEEGRVVLFYPNNSWGQEINTYCELEAEEFGITIQSKESFDPNSSDQRAVATKIMNANPEIIIAKGFGTAFESVLRNLSELGYKGKIIGDLTISLPGSINNTKGIMEGAYSISSDIKEDGDELASKYVAAYKERFNEDPSVWDALAFDTCQYLIAALKVADEKGISLKDAMYAVSDVDLLLGHNTFGNSNDVVFEMSVYQIIDGKPMLIK